MVIYRSIKYVTRQKKFVCLFCFGPIDITQSLISTFKFIRLLRIVYNSLTTVFRGMEAICVNVVMNISKLDIQNNQVEFCVG